MIEIDYFFSRQMKRCSSKIKHIYSYTIFTLIFNIIRNLHTNTALIHNTPVMKYYPAVSNVKAMCHACLMTVCCPGPPLTPSQVRRMSELSSLSVTVAERDFKMRPVR